jgi:hypothetical protein
MRITPAELQWRMIMRRAARKVRAAARKIKSRVATKNLLPTPQTPTQQLSSRSLRKRNRSSSTNSSPYLTTMWEMTLVRIIATSRTLKIKVMKV